MENIEIKNEEKFKKEQKELELKEESTEIRDRILLTIELLMSKNQEEKNTLDDQGLKDIERRSQNESNIQELKDLDSNAKNEENDLAVVEMIDEYLQSNFGEPKYDTNGDLIYDPYVSRAKENVAMMKIRLTPLMSLEKEIKKDAKKRIEELVKNYRKLIEKFNTTYANYISPLTCGPEVYINNYRMQLEALSYFKREEFAKIIEFILNEITENLNFDSGMLHEISSKILLRKLRRQFIQNSPIQTDSRVLKALASSIYSEVPVIKPEVKNNSNIEKIILEWWGIEKWKHKMAKEIIKYSNKRIIRDDKVGSLIHKMIIDGKEVITKFQTKEERDKAISERTNAISKEKTNQSKSAIHSDVAIEFSVSEATVVRACEKYK